MSLRTDWFDLLAVQGTFKSPKFTSFINFFDQFHLIIILWVLMLFVLFTYTWLKILKFFPHIHAPTINLSMCCLHTCLCPLHSSKDLPQAFLRITNDNVPNFSLFSGITIHKLPAKCLVHTVDIQQIIRYRRSVGQAPSFMYRTMGGGSLFSPLCLKQHFG